VTEPIDALIVSQPVGYGVGVFVRDLTRAAAAAGHLVTVVSPGEEHGPLAAWVRDAGVEHRRLDMARSPAPRDVTDLVALRRLMLGRDVVHAHSSKAGALCRLAAMTIRRDVRPAVIVTAHYWSWLVGGTGSALYRSIERLLAARCDALVAVSDREAEEGRRVLGPAAPIRSIPNGVDRERFHPTGLRADRDLDAPLLVCVGRLSRQKGQDVAIRALASLADGRARLRLVGAESAPGERARLEALARTLGLADRIEWRGAVQDTAPEYRAADVVLTPSRWDGMSLALLEAMACGAAIVATDVSGSEALRDAGTIVPPDDPEAMAAAVQDLLERPEMAARARARARERSASFDLASTMERNLALWRSVTPDRGVLRSAPRPSTGSR
jgi:glycosyltransferase involved in cell wall biosynthesis